MSKLMMLTRLRRKVKKSKMMCRMMLKMRKKMQMTRMMRREKRNLTTRMEKMQVMKIMRLSKTKTNLEWTKILRSRVWMLVREANLERKNALNQSTRIREVTKLMKSVKRSLMGTSKSIIMIKGQSWSVPSTGKAL